MFNRILVPLDGSRMAESALPAAENIARNFHARVCLLHIVEEDAPDEDRGDRCCRCTYPGVGARLHVHRALVLFLLCRHYYLPAFSPAVLID